MTRLVCLIFLFLSFLICAKKGNILWNVYNLHFHKLKDTSNLTCVLYYDCYLLNDWCNLIPLMYVRKITTVSSLILKLTELDWNEHLFFNHPNCLQEKLITKESCIQQMFLFFSISRLLNFNHLHYLVIKITSSIYN